MFRVESEPGYSAKRQHVHQPGVNDVTAKELKMRFMVMHYSTEDNEAGVPPPQSKWLQSVS